KRHASKNLKHPEAAEPGLLQVICCTLSRTMKTCPGAAYFLSYRKFRGIPCLIKSRRQQAGPYKKEQVKIDITISIIVN
ncbi:MAG: hypothetical protein IJJ52_03775, partial [Lachnospiraceae bacterium]|nr:hypothetical protein [Lachnospiraceae bacterium]